MKNLIVAASAVILILTIMQLQFQCNELLRRKQNLKYAADEAAASAALCCDDESFGIGVLKFDRRTAQKRAEETIRLNLTGRYEENLRWEIRFFDEEQDRPHFVVTIYQRELKAVSTYEYVGC